MADLFTYLRWRGDLPFSQVPPTPVDALIFSILSYIDFDGLVPTGPDRTVTLAQVARLLHGEPDAEKRQHFKEDLKLLDAAAATLRFSSAELTCYQDVFVPAEDTQFAALTFLLGDNSAFLAFRGTDQTLVGWKEDFNMAFEESIPAQRLAKAYVQAFAAQRKERLRLGGHSKGGNLAVYAAAKVPADLQQRILAVYNHDGPGFTEHMMSNPGYLRMVPKLLTYVPQSSVIGMLLEHEEEYTIIKSKHIGVLQHDPYTWEVMGGSFITVKALTADSRFLDRTLKHWLAGMTTQERNAFVDTVFDLLMVEENMAPRDLVRPQNLRTYLKTLQGDENARHLLAAELINLVNSARHALGDGEDKSDETK